MKAPKPTDPYQSAQAQAGANFTAAQQNWGFQYPDQVTPYGNQTWEQSGWQPIYDSSGRVTYSPRYTSKITLSPGEEQIRQQNEKLRLNFGNIANQQANMLGGIYNKTMDTSGLDFRRDEGATDRAAIEKAMLDRWTRDASKQNAAQEVQAANRGLMPGGQAYGTMKEGQDRARTDAVNQAYLASGQEFRAAQQAYNDATAQRQTGRIQLWDQPLKTAMAMAGFAQPNTPSFTPNTGTSTSAPNIMQAISANDQARMNAYSGLMGGIFNTAGAIGGALPWASMLPFSDRRLKRDIRRIDGETLAGAPVYSFVFREHPLIPEHLQGKRHKGVMADEVRPLHPDAVYRMHDGYDRVSYDLLHMRNDNGR